ncbi:MAG: SGNH/GDSL hydrolase family protein [Acidimicrobiales bacterium]
MSVATPRSSPWDVAVPARRSHRGLLAPLAWLLGIAGVVAQVQGYGPTQQRCAAYLAAAAALLVGALAVRAGLLLRALVALVAVGVAVVLARPSLGLTVVGLGLASTALATAAVVGVPIARRSTRMVGPAALAVPFLAFAGLSWYRTASLPRAAVGLVLAAAVVAVDAVRPGVLARLDRAVARGLAWLGRVIAGLVLLLASLLVVYLPGLLVRAARAVGIGRPRPGWQHREVDLQAARTDARYPSASTDARSRRRHLASGLGITCVVVVAFAVWLRSQPPEVEYRAVAPAGSSGSASSDPANPGATPTTSTPKEAPQGAPVKIDGIRYSQTEAGRGLSWADQVQQDQASQQLPPDTLAGFRSGDLTSKTTNVRDGERRTIASPSCDCRPVVVWLMGGSVAFGTGQRDEHTIASELVRQAAGRGYQLEVHNYGVPGYTLWQEYQVLMARLGSTQQPPDVVVFYDGFNDLIGTFEQALVGEDDFTKPVVYDPEALGKLQGLGDQLDDRLAQLGGIDGLAASGAARYSRLLDLVLHQMDQLGISAGVFLQPDFTASPVQRQAILHDYPDLPRVFADLIGKYFAAASGQLPDQVVDLRHIFDDEPASVFFDLAHTNEHGAAVAATAVYQRLEPELARRAPDARGGPALLLEPRHFGPAWVEGRFDEGGEVAPCGAVRSGPSATSSVGRVSQRLTHDGVVQEVLRTYRTEDDAKAAFAASRAAFECARGTVDDGAGGTVPVTLSARSIDLTEPADQVAAHRITTPSFAGGAAEVRRGRRVLVIQIITRPTADPAGVPDLAGTVDAALARAAR